MYFVTAKVKLKLHTHQVRLEKLTLPDISSALSNLVRKRDEELAKIMLDLCRTAQCSLASQANGKDTTTLRITFAHRNGINYLDRLLTALAGQCLNTQQAEYLVDAIDLPDDIWAGINTWQDLLTETTTPVISLVFITPAALTHKHNSIVFPEPLILFGDLLEKWQSLNGPVLPNELNHYLKTGGCVVADYHLSTQSFCTEQEQHRGLVGQIKYQCRKDNKACITALHALARLASYTSVGYYTALGMGAVVLN
jgi:hypothetical protein